MIRIVVECQDCHETKTTEVTAEEWKRVGDAGLKARLGGVRCTLCNGGLRAKVKADGEDAVAALGARGRIIYPESAEPAR